MISTVRIAVIGLWAQGVAGLGWWGMLWLMPQTQRWFMAPDAPSATLWAFAFPDIPMFVVGSFVLAIGVSQQRSWSWPGLVGLTGAVLYATLYCWGLWWLTSAALIGAVLMTLSSIQLFTWVVLLRPKLETSGNSSWGHKNGSPNESQE